MVVAEVLTGIALVKQATDFIKSNIDTVKDIGEIGHAPWRRAYETQSRA